MTIAEKKLVILFLGLEQDNNFYEWMLTSMLSRRRKRMWERRMVSVLPPPLSLPALAYLLHSPGILIPHIPILPTYILTVIIRSLACEDNSSLGRVRWVVGGGHGVQHVSLYTFVL